MDSNVRAIARRALPASLKALVARLLCNALTGRLIAAMHRDRIPFGRLTIDTAHGVISARTKARIFFGIYESAEVRCIRTRLRNDLDVVELGSSIGVLS